MRLDLMVQETITLHLLIFGESDGYLMVGTTGNQLLQSVSEVSKETLFVCTAGEHKPLMKRDWVAGRTKGKL